MTAMANNKFIRSKMQLICKFFSNKNFWLYEIFHAIFLDLHFQFAGKHYYKKTLGSIKRIQKNSIFLTYEVIRSTVILRNLYLKLQHRNQNQEEIEMYNEPKILIQKLHFEKKC